jgi:hypothetical protein
MILFLLNYTNYPSVPFGLNFAKGVYTHNVAQYTDGIYLVAHCKEMM